MKIGCCSSFKKCSDAGRCVQIDNPDYEEEFKECYYNENLEKGLNFYTEYNDNNKARAEEYELQQIEENQSISEIVDEIHITDEISEKNNKYMNGYIVLDGRAFYIGTRGGYKNYTYGLGSDGINRLKEDLKDFQINIINDYSEEMLVDEKGSDTDRAEWRVYVTIADIGYHIMNSDMRALKVESAKSVANYFSNMGYKAVCECLGNDKRSINVTLPIESKNTNKPTIEVVEVIVKVEEDNSQMSLFDL